MIIDEILLFLEKLGFSGQNCVLAEKYLNENLGNEVLDQFERVAFSNISYDMVKQAKTFMKGLNRENKTETAIRLFRVLYAVGHHTCAIVLNNCIDWIYGAKELELYQRMAVYVHHHTENTDFARLTKPEQWNCLMDMADNDPEQIRAAIGMLEEEGGQYILIVLTLYFNMKYQSCDKIAEEDMVLMEVYENTLLDWLDIWIVRKGCEKRAEVREAVRTGQITKEIIYFMKTQSMSKSEMEHFIAICSMAYLNFPRSHILKNIVKSCMAIYPMAALFALEDASIGEHTIPANIRIDGADYDALFAIDPETYICWAAMTDNSKILKRQLEKHQELCVKALQEETFEMPIRLYRRVGGNYDSDAMRAINVLKDVIKEENPQLYQQAITSMKLKHNQMISELVADSPHAAFAKEYLRGDCTVSALYAYSEEYEESTRYMYRIQDSLYQYQKHCIDEDFIRRCKVFLVVANYPYLKIQKGSVNAGGVKQFFADLDKEQLDIAHQLAGFCSFYKAGEFYSGCSLPALLEDAEEVFADYLCTRREETLAAFFQAGVGGRYLALRVMRRNLSENKQEILKYVADGAKLVREELLGLLYIQTDWAEEVKSLLQSKKTAAREIAVHVLAHWQQNGGNFNEVLLQALEKEKNAKVITLLQNALNIEENAFADKPLSRQELVEKMHRGNRKKTLMWAYAEPFSIVHKVDGGVVSEEYLQAILLCYASQDKYGVSKNAVFLAGDLDSTEFARYVNELFDKWLAQEADSKKRWVLYAAAIHGGEDIIQKLQHQIQKWPQEARGAIAAEAVKALALNPLPQALLLVEGMARKFKFKQVKAAAGDAFEFAATELGITREELSDRIVPNLGFDVNMERVFDYGERVFKAVLTPALDIEVYDSNGKRLKNLPVPGKKDDKEKAPAAQEAFKQLKKQIKTIVTSQKARLEYALSIKREWRVDAWANLFVKNPVMHQFAIGLIWGVYDKDKLVQSFRYMEDGSFTIRDGEAYTLPEDANISLVHPMELSEEEKAAWREQLEDYEIIQPIEQINRAVFYVAEEEENEKSMERFGGYIINDLSFNGKLTALGWYRGSVEDAGYFHTYYREDKEAGIGVELHFSGAYIGGMNEDVTIYDARFYKEGTIAHGSYVYDEADEEKAHFLKDVPPRYFSEIVLQLTNATASSIERDLNWKKKAWTL